MMDQNDWYSPNKSDSTPYYEIHDIENIQDMQNIDTMPNLENMQHIDNIDHMGNIDHAKFNDPLVPQIPPNMFDGQTDHHGGKMDFPINYDFDLAELDGVGYLNNQPESHGQHHNKSHSHSHLHHHSLHNNSSAFPPTIEIENTPLIIPNKDRLSDTVINSPILPSQNDKSFNNQHYYHKLQRNKSKELFEVNQNNVRPDSVFTPLVSPSNTPLDKKYSNPINTTFEPLTSPALNAQDKHSNNNNKNSTSNGFSKRRSSSSAFNEEKPIVHKRRTPHGTPILATNKKSPSSAVSNSNFEKLPESSVNYNNSSNSNNYNGNRSGNNNDLHNGSNSSSNSNSSTPMLPPQKKIENNNSSPQLMSFTMGKLAKQQSQSSVDSNNSNYQVKNQNVGQNQNNQALVNESPILKSRNSSISRSVESSPNLLSRMKTGEKPTTKKASHKLAEQGRRNRMNLAVHTLGSLIPQHYHDQVSIPSKATTVELAAKYIGDLLNELNDLKKS